MPGFLSDIQQILDANFMGKQYSNSHKT